MGRKGNSSKVTSAKAARAASRTLRDGRTSKASKTAAASALSQTPSRRSRKPEVADCGCRSLIVEERNTRYGNKSRCDWLQWFKDS